LKEWGYAEVTSYYDPTLPSLTTLFIYLVLIVILIYLIKAYRKRNSRIIVLLSIFAGIIFFARLMFVFPNVITTTDTPGIYLLLTIAELIFLFLTLFYLRLFYLYKYETSKDLKGLTNIELITIMVQFISMVLLFLSTIRGFSVFFIVSVYLGYSLLFLGAFTYYRTKHRICISFITWGIFIMLWMNNYY
jgi:hypothetical protein